MVAFLRQAKLEILSFTLVVDIDMLTCAECNGNYSRSCKCDKQKFSHVYLNHVLSFPTKYKVNIKC